MTQTKIRLRYIGPAIKVSVPSVGAEVERGKDHPFPPDVARRLLKSGNWEEVKATPKTSTTKERESDGT